MSSEGSWEPRREQFQGQDNVLVPPPGWAFTVGGCPKHSTGLSEHTPPLNIPDPMKPLHNLE